MIDKDGRIIQARACEVSEQNLVDGYPGQFLVIRKEDGIVGYGHAPAWRELFIVQRDGEGQRRRHDRAIELPQVRSAQDTVIIRSQVHEARVSCQFGQPMTDGHIDQHGAAQSSRPSRKTLVRGQFGRMRQDDSARLAASEHGEHLAVPGEHLVVAGTRRVYADDYGVVERPVRQARGKGVVEKPVCSDEPRRQRPVDQQQQDAREAQCNEAVSFLVRADVQVFQVPVSGGKV